MSDREQECRDKGLSFILDMLDQVPKECRDCDRLFGCPTALLATLKNAGATP